MQDYRRLLVWQKAHEFVLSAYRYSKSFPREEIYSLTSQLRRAAVSIAANIAEGCGKKSPKEFAWFLNVSLGSANECEYFLLLTKDLKYLDESAYRELHQEINLVKAMLINLIKSVSLKISG